MRKLKVLAVGAGLAALITTSVAAAHNRQERAQTADVAATFTATATNSSTRTCTGEGGVTFRITRTLWNGMATSTEPRLNGALRVWTRTVVNESTGDGWLTGWWRTRPNGHRSWASLTAVIDDGNKADGLARGHVRQPWGKLLGNWSATINGNAIAGSLGANAPGVPDNSAIIYRHGCT